MPLQSDAWDECNSQECREADTKREHKDSESFQADLASFCTWFSGRLGEDVHRLDIDQLAFQVRRAAEGSSFDPNTYAPFIGSHDADVPAGRLPAKEWHERHSGDASKGVTAENTRQLKLRHVTVDGTIYSVIAVLHHKGTEAWTVNGDNTNPANTNFTTRLIDLRNKCHGEEGIDARAPCTQTNSQPHSAALVCFLQ